MLPIAVHAFDLECKSKRVMNFYSLKNLNKISEEEIVTFLRYLVNERQVSTSYQNQSNNAIYKLCMRINPFNFQLDNKLYFSSLTNKLNKTIAKICEQVVRLHNFKCSHILVLCVSVKRQTTRQIP